MINKKIISCKFILLLFFVSNAFAELEKDEFTKKYWKPRTQEITELNDYLHKNDRVDLKENINFFISYNKDCFSIDFPLYDKDYVKEPLKELDGFNFIRKDKCKKTGEYVFADSIQLRYQTTYNSNSKAFKSFGKSPYESKKILVDGVLRINGERATVTSSFYEHHLDESSPYFKLPVNKKTPEALRRYKKITLEITYEILCPGKINKSYTFQIIANNYQEQLDFATKHNYQLPDDIMQIISTFKCRKDR